MNNYYVNTFPNSGYISTKFTDEQLAPIRKEISKIQSNFDLATKSNDSLIGHLKHEYKLIECKEYLEKLVLPFIAEYDNQFDYLNDYDILSKSVPIYLADAWVNFQQKYEFNPVHNHSGIMSFTCWLQIPYEYENERNVFADVTEKKFRGGFFGFHFIDTLGKMQYKGIKMDKSKENEMVIFPSDFLHSVNPFYTSDDYRISISGNFKFMV